MYLVQLVSEYKEVLENKQTNSETICYSCRSSKMIRNCWENIKKRTKKHFAEQKKNLYKTGGGQSQIVDNIMFNKARDIIQPSVDRLTNMYDSDSFASIQNEETYDTLPSTDSLNVEDNIEYLDEYEDYVNCTQKENKPRNVIETISTNITDNEIDDEDLTIAEKPVTKEKKRKITESKNIDHKRSRFISIKEKNKKESSKTKIDEFTNLAKSKTELSIYKVFIFSSEVHRDFRFPNFLLTIS
ncbi:hypothetical protein PUN28_000512 [Cardiocondyla obscurior]|uniref:BESS domain-containing protein n=1 Tax=Cardiocondyla obscurior TaxID=286306 RepID=A0AAW2H0E7_9HYME